MTSPLSQTTEFKTSFNNEFMIGERGMMEERGDWRQTENDRLQVERVVRKEWGFTGDEEWYTKYFVGGAVHNDSDYYDNDSIGGSGGVMATKGGGRKEDHDYNHCLLFLGYGFRRLIIG